MPSYLIGAGYSLGTVQNDVLTRYVIPAGSVTLNSTEAYTQLRARDSYTWSNLFVRVMANSLTSATTIKSRINGGDGNQVISIGAAATGAFTDAVNSDSLVSGNLFCIQSVTGTGTSISFTIFSYILSTASNTTPILAGSGGYFEGSYRWQYPIINGMSSSAGNPPDEPYNYYKFRATATLSNLRTYVHTNSVTVATTVKTRVNGADGNQVLSIGGGATGSFEDTSNTDSISIGDDVNYYVYTNTSSTEGAYLTVFQLKSNSAGRQVCASYRYTGRAFTYNQTRYIVIEGAINQTTTEAHTQATARAEFTAKNMYVSTGDTSYINGITTIKIRKNGADGNLVISIPSDATGQFEDLVNSDEFIATDTLNWKVVTAGSSGDIYLTIIGFELEPAAPPGWSGKVSGVTDPAKVMGVDKANIAKVKGVVSA